MEQSPGFMDDPSMKIFKQKLEIVWEGLRIPALGNGMDSRSFQPYGFLIVQNLNNLLVQYVDKFNCMVMQGVMLFPINCRDATR